MTETGSCGQSAEGRRRVGHPGPRSEAPPPLSVSPCDVGPDSVQTDSEALQAAHICTQTVIQ